VTAYECHYGRRVRAQVASDIAPVLATVAAREGDTAVGWTIVELDRTSDDHPMLMAPYVHLPINRCEAA
jgi:hypothetical protein